MTGSSVGPSVNHKDRQLLLVSDNQIRASVAGWIWSLLQSLFSFFLQKLCNPWRTVVCVSLTLDEESVTKKTLRLPDMRVLLAGRVE